MDKVLLVNDCKFESMIMRDMLKSMGYEVSITNEYDVMQKIEEVSPNILICNLIMKETTGNLVIKNVKARKREIVCYLSSSNELEYNDYKIQGVDGLIKTPVDVNELNKIIKKKNIAFCPGCGEKLDKYNSKIAFCPYCGYKL